MFSQTDINQVTVKGHNADPSAILIESNVKNNFRRIENYFNSTQARAVSGHLVQKILSAVGFSGELYYEDVEWACRRKLVSIGNALRLTSIGNYGDVFNGAFIKGQDEIISLVARPIDPSLSFKDYTPAVYLYHEYTNLNWKLGDDRPRGVSIIEINLVALLWQYLNAVIYYRNSQTPITSPVYIQRHIISRMIPSFMDIAFLNLHRALALGWDTPQPEKLTVVPTPPLHDIAMRNAQNVRKYLLTRDLIPGEVLYSIPQFFIKPGIVSTALDRIVHRDRGQTVQGSWHYNIVNWYWMYFCLQYNKRAMDKFKKSAIVDLERFEDSKVLRQLPKAMYTHLRRDLIMPLYVELEK